MSDAPVVIAKEDRLQAELLHSKMQNIQLQMQLMQSEIQKAIEARNGIIGEMNKFKDEFQAKYGLDLSKIQINSDGSVQDAVTPRIG
jgi:hypothetical protein